MVLKLVSSDDDCHAAQGSMNLGTSQIISMKRADHWPWALWLILCIDTHFLISFPYGGCLKWGVPPNHPYSSILIGFSWIFHYIIHFGVASLMEPPQKYLVPFPKPRKRDMLWPPWSTMAHSAPRARWRIPSVRCGRKVPHLPPTPWPVAAMGQPWGPPGTKSVRKWWRLVVHNEKWRGIIQDLCTYRSLRDRCVLA